MAETISAKTRFAISVTSTDTSGAATQTATVPINESETLSNGTSAGEVDTAYAPQGTLAPAGSLSIDLDSGSLTGPLLDVQTFAEVQTIYVENTGSTNSMTISGDFLGLSTDTLTIEPGGKLMYDFGDAGRAVTASTADNITIASTGGTTYRLVIVGRSA